MSNDETGKTKWWMTLPAFVTAIAALLGAITTSIVALNSSGAGEGTTEQKRVEQPLDPWDAARLSAIFRVGELELAVLRADGDVGAIYWVDRTRQPEPNSLDVLVGARRVEGSDTSNPLPFQVLTSTLASSVSEAGTSQFIGLSRAGFDAGVKSVRKKSQAQIVPGEYGNFSLAAGAKEPVEFWVTLGVNPGVLKASESKLDLRLALTMSDDRVHYVLFERLTLEIQTR